MQGSIASLGAAVSGVHHNIKDKLQFLAVETRNKLF